MKNSAPSKRAKQKRNRIITACFDCRERKAGCDRKKPICSRCHDGRTCIYLDPPNNALINGVSRKVASLPSDIKGKVTRLYSQCLGDTKDEGDGSDFEGLEASPLVTDSASYDDDADETEVTDLGFRVGKLHLTDRVGGQYRPGMAHEMKMLLQATGHQREWTEEQKIWPTPPDMFETGTSSPMASFLQPSAAYLAPNLHLLSLGPNHDLMNYLPPHNISVRILQQYWTSVHPVARVLHRPSFEKRWQTFTQHLNSKVRPTKPLQALVFSILFSGIVAMPHGTLDREMDEDQQLWVANLKAGTEIALTQAQMLQTAKVETLQAFVAYLIVLCRDEVSRIHSSLVAAAIRVAECNGLHCDGEQRGYKPIETHVRRLIWFNLCFLDIRTAEAQGPRPIISVEDYTTKMPANINDTDLTNGSSPEPGYGQWTEMTVPLIRFRCNEFIRSIWVSRRKVMAREMSVTPVIDGIESFRLEWSLKYTPDKPNDPLQRYGLCMLDLQTARTYAMVLHPYHIHPRLRMPDRLLSVLIENGIKTMDRVIELETSEDYAPWRWYAGALQQHHYALLMATEIIMNPRRKESCRIWRGLDYVFEPPNLPPVAKARWVISQAWWKTEVYLGKRALRVPINLEQNLREALKFSGEETRRGDRQSTTSSEATVQDDVTSEPSTVGGQPAHKHASNVATSKKRARSPKANNEALEQAHKTDPLQRTSLSPTTSEPTTSHAAQSSPLTTAPTKQVVDVDWRVLDSYYPPEQYNGDLDVPFETWSYVLHSTPFPSSNSQNNATIPPAPQYSFNCSSDMSSFPAPEQLGAQQWPGMWPQPSLSAQQQQLSSYGLGYSTTQPHQHPQGPTWDGSSSTLPTSDTSPAQWNARYAVHQSQTSAAHSIPQQQYGLPPTPVNVSIPNHDPSAEERRKQNSELNFGMGIYQPLPRQNR